MPLELDPVCVEYSVTYSCDLHLWSSDGFPGASVGQRQCPGRGVGLPMAISACQSEVSSGSLNSVDRNSGPD